MQKRIIAFKLIDHEHNADDIVECIMSVVDDFDISNRIISITLDNASANTTAVGELNSRLSGYKGGLFLYQRCACDIINLIVKSGMKVVSRSINGIRDAISWINHSNTHIAEFKRDCKIEAMKPRKFGLDMPVRWNSTHMMLKNVVEYKNIINVFCNAKTGSRLLQDSECIIVERFVNYLEVFCDSVVSLSGVYYPTSSLALHQIFEITSMFHLHREDELLKPIVEAMERKFKKYWSEIPFLYLGLDLSPQVTDVREKLFEVYAVYESRFNNLRNQKTQEAQNRPKKKYWYSWNLISSFASSSSSSSLMPPPSTPTTNLRT